MFQAGGKAQFVDGGSGSRSVRICSSVPVTVSASGAKLTILRADPKSPICSWRIPTREGPRTVPKDAYVMTIDRPTATSRVRMPGR